MSKVLPFRNPRHVDIDALSTAIFLHLAGSPGVEARTLVKAFRRRYPKLSTGDFLQGFALAKKVLNIFERLTVELDHAGDGDAG